MKQRSQIALVFILALLLAFGLFGIWQARHPKLFFGNYQSLVKWDFGDGLGLSDGRYVYYDLHENVLMVVQVEPSHAVQWLVDAQPVGPFLRVRRQRDDMERVIEWRRDCIITLDGEANPTYKSLSPQALHQAVSTSMGWDESFIKMIDGPSSPPATSPSTAPTALRSVR
jgi:hypothetical protein